MTATNPEPSLTPPRKTKKKNLLGQALIVTLSFAPIAHADEAMLLQRIDKLAAELEQIKA